MNLSKGERVRHPRKLEWGLGQVLDDTQAGITHVFFVGAGERKMAGQYVTLEAVPADQAAHPVLDNLHLDSTGSITYRTLEDLTQVFLRDYDGGFHGEPFRYHERDYKVAAHELCTELLDADALAGLLSQACYEDICTRASQVINKTNLLFPNEKMAWRDGVCDAEHAEATARTLVDLLYGEAPMQARFEAFATVLARFGADKWTTASYFPFLRFPDDHMFVKPTITQRAAAVCAFDISYQSKLNWGTYQRVLAFSEYLREALGDLQPRDLIDIQSFIWCTAEPS